MGYYCEDYSETFKHADGRKVIFVGDLIDRGTKGFETVQIAKSMCDAGNAIAVMGNHELNAIFFHTKDNDGKPLREHTKKNINQHCAFLYQFAMNDDGDKQGKEIIDWFKTLPLYFEHEYFRVVHACWDDESKLKLDKILDDKNCLPEEMYKQASKKGNEVFNIIETWLKGDEQHLPLGVSFLDKSGHERKEARLRWWMEKETGLEDLAMLQGEADIIDEIRAKLRGVQIESRVVYTDKKPVFIGHYWMKGNPVLQTPYVCCVDYSAGKGDKLCAYRWDGETELSAEKFIFEHF